MTTEDQAIPCALCGAIVTRIVKGEKRHATSILQMWGVYTYGMASFSSLLFSYCEPCTRKVLQAITELRAKEQGWHERHPSAQPVNLPHEDQNHARY